MKYIRLFVLVFLGAFIAMHVEAGDPKMSLMGNRFLTLNTVIRVNQIEVARNRNAGFDERDMHTPEKVISFRESVERAFPGSRITWAFSWLALHDTTENYQKIRETVVAYHEKYGDEITFIPGAYFANAYNSTEQVNKDIHDALDIISSLVGSFYRPKSIVAGFLSSKNQEYLAEEEKIHVCQGNIWSQYSIDNQDGDGSVCYPYYPSKEHFCKPAQNKRDFIDCVNLDGWTIDFLAGRREGFEDGFNSRMGVGPIETIGWYGPDKGLEEVMHTAAIHYDKGFEENGFAWITNCWEISLKYDHRFLQNCLESIRKCWPDVKFITQGEFGLLWRKEFKSNHFNYKFQEKGSGIGGSDNDKEIRWYMNKSFRMALLKDLDTGIEKVIDFTSYEKKAVEPESGTTRNWTLFGDINQKHTRDQDQPVAIRQLNAAQKELVRSYYPELLQ